MAALPLQAPTVVIHSHQTLPQALVDRLGKLQAELAPLKNEEAALKALLRDSGLEVIEGDLYRCTITPGKPGQKIDWEGICRTRPSLLKLVPQFTTVTDAPEARVAVKARKGV